MLQQKKKTLTRLENNFLINMLLISDNKKKQLEKGLTRHLQRIAI